MLYKTFLSLVFGAVVVVAVQNPYEQCGGINWTGGTTCTAGWTCQYQNACYSQCLPASKTTTTGSTTQSPSTTANTAVQTPYGQCGGINWTGGTKCTAGWTCQYQNPYYSQCLQAPSSSATPGTTKASSTTVTTTKSLSTTTKSPTTSSAKSTSTTTIANQPSSTTSTVPKSSTTSASSSNPTYKASITHYGAGDSFGSPNCNTNTAACGFYTYPGYSAAISQNFYGAGPGDGAGPACGTCWRVTGQTDSSGNRLSNAGTSIVVMINNLCPAAGNPLCAQNGMAGTNQYGANVNFDLCSDSGAQYAFFGNSGVGLAIGTAVQVDCSQWSGTVVH